MEIVDLKKVSEKEVVRRTVRVLRQGGLVVYPTETVYGLGADATNKIAINRLLAYKGKRAGKAISVAVVNQKMAEKYVKLNETARNLYSNFLPGPVTVISRVNMGNMEKKGKKIVAEGVMSAEGTLGIRWSSCPLVSKIVETLGRPITATSANPSGEIPPRNITNFLKNLSQKKKNMLALILDAGELPKREVSTVVDTTREELEILRQGDIVLRKSEHEWISGSEKETRKIGSQLVKLSREAGSRSAGKIKNSPSGAGSPQAEKLKIKNSKQIIKRAKVFALVGELGAGKTRLAQGIARALGIKEVVNSPTFNLLKEYPTKKGIFAHIDAWRIFTEEEFRNLGVEKYLEGQNIIVIEWAEKIKNIIDEWQEKAEIFWVKIEQVSPMERKICLY